MYVLAISGSHNINGNTAFILKTVLDEARNLGLDTELANGCEAVSDCKNPFCIECITPCNGVCYRGTKLEILFEKMKKADALVIGSPVYFGDMSSQLKAVFDKSRLLRMNGDLYNKFGVAVAVGASFCGGQEQTVRSIHNAMLIQGMVIVGDGYLSDGMGHFGIGALRPAEDDNGAIVRAKALGRRLAGLRPKI